MQKLSKIQTLKMTIFLLMIQILEGKKDNQVKRRYLNNHNQN
jgi:hypothetical protein